MQRKILVLCFTFVVVAELVSGQSEPIIIKDAFKTEKKDFSKAWKAVKYAEEYYKIGTSGAFLTALDYYLEAYEYNTENAALNYKIGVCYLKSIQKAKSLTYFQYAFTLKQNVMADIHLQLGKAYHQNYRFEEAIEEYNLYKSSLTGENKRLGEPLVNKLITECKNGIELIKNKENVTIENLSEINSEYPDYCPLISADESMLIFTSRRDDTYGGGRAKEDNQYYEDIYTSVSTNYVWGAPKNIGKPINTPVHDATVGLSPDGQQLLTYSMGDIYISQLNGDEWGEPKPLSKKINNPATIETSACFSYDGKSIYFVSGRNPNDPDNSNGDIFVCTKNKKGEWDNPKRLPDIVNSKYDEEGVFLHPDGRTLFFSSKGHNSMGGFDIFKTTMNKDGSWIKPENLGYPINTPDDDVYFVLSASGRHGYYSGVRSDAKGFTDIYKITFLTDNLLQNTEDNLISVITQPVNMESAVELKTIMLTLVKGKIIDETTGTPIEAQIEIVDNETEEVVFTTSSNRSTGNFLVSLPSGKNYGMAIKKDGYLFHSENFDIPETQTFKEVVKNVGLSSITTDAKIVLRNIFFDTGKFELKKESQSEMQRLVELMKKYPNMKVEVSGHTDNIGNEEVNHTLSENRAKSVVDYLIKKGIASARLQYKGCSFTQPIADNATSEGRAQNRRVEFKIISY